MRMDGELPYLAEPVLPTMSGYRIRGSGPAKVELIGRATSCGVTVGIWPGSAGLSH